MRTGKTPPVRLSDRINQKFFSGSTKINYPKPQPLNPLYNVGKDRLGIEPASTGAHQVCTSGAALRVNG